jgi:arylsulfatase A-like enzyme
VTVTHQVQTIDIFPTILDILKIPLKHKIDGESLAGFFEEPEEFSFREDAYAETDVNYFENNPYIKINGIDGKHRMIRTEKWKLIYIPSPNSKVFELYDLETDPGEQKDVCEKYPEVLADLKNRLFLWMTTGSCVLCSEADENIEMKKRLKELGYM